MLNKKILTGLFVMAASSTGFAKTGPMGREMKDVLKTQQSLGAKPIETLSPAEARLQPTPADGVKAILAEKGRVPDMTGLEKVYDIMLSGGKGQIPARVYKPKGENLPVTVYFHGGGWVIADLDTYEGSAYALAKKSKNIVVSVEYRQGPENPFPAAHEDAFAAYRWVLDHAKELGGDPKRVAVAGESAGGNLAINVSLKARDEKVQAPIHQVAIYPVAGADMTTESYRENEDAKPLNKDMMEWFVKHALGSPEKAKDPRINLVEANLKGLPPTTLILAEIDPLRSEGEMLAEKMKKEGVKVRSKVFKGAAHEFFGMADLVPQAKEAQAFAAEALTSPKPRMN